MSESPGDTEFGVDDQRVQDFAAGFAGEFGAALLAPVWRAMLQAGVVAAPARVAVDRAEVVLIGPNSLELRVPISTTNGELMKSLTVYVNRWPAGDDLTTEVVDAAGRLADALEASDGNATFSYRRGPSQKPHN